MSFVQMVPRASSERTQRASQTSLGKRGSPLDEPDQIRNKEGMDTPSPLALASMILAAPGWARVGIAAPSERTREAAALELGAVIAERIGRPAELAAEGQLALSL